MSADASGAAPACGSRSGHPGAGRMMASTAERVLSPAGLVWVARTGLLDTPQEEAFDRFTRLAAATLGDVTAFVTIVDDRRSSGPTSHTAAITPAMRAPAPAVVSTASIAPRTRLRRQATTGGSGHGPE